MLRLLTDAIEAFENFFTMAANIQVVLVYGGKTSETRETVRSWARSYKVVIWCGEEHKAFEPSLQALNEEERSESKQVRSKDQYESYKYVLPSDRAVVSYKHDKFLHQKIMAASKVTLHYDTITRSRIDGEWPAVILNIVTWTRKSTKW